MELHTRSAWVKLKFRVNLPVGIYLLRSETTSRHVPDAFDVIDGNM